jgi:hypothetical protein
VNNRHQFGGHEPFPFILPFSHWPTKRFPLGYKLVPSPHILSSVHDPDGDKRVGMSL